MRFGLEVTESVAKVIPDNIVLGARITVTDHVKNGWDIPSTIEFAKQLKNIRVDFIDCSGYSGLLPWDPSIKSDTYTVQLNASERIQKELEVPTSVVGGVLSPQYAEAILKNKTASLVMLGRGFLDDPHWPYHAADALQLNRVDDIYPIHYGYAISDKKFRNKLKNAF